MLWPEVFFGAAELPLGIVTAFAGASFLFIPYDTKWIWGWKYMILRFDGIHVRIGGKEIVKGADLCTEEGRSQEL